MRFTRRWRASSRATPGAWDPSVAPLGLMLLTALLKHQRYREMPWRNGRGSTLEIAREPPDSEQFAWRLSLARIQRSCSFSAYPGYRRALVLVSGEHLRLTFWSHGSRALGPNARCVRFEGSWRTRCSVSAACTDLSLIVRNGSRTMRPSILRAPIVLRVDTERRLSIPSGLHVALMSLRGTVAVGDSTGSRARRLHPLDTLLLRPAPSQILHLRRVKARYAELVVLRWRPGGN